MNLEKARAVFFELVGNVPAEQWDARLAELAGDDEELRRRVALLLAAHRDDGSFLDSPAPGLGGTIDQPIHEGPGTVIGQYKLLEQIGEGGFGIVFMAEQTEPVRRKVALKVLKAGMDTRQVVARFEAERQALAIMDHPNIAKVFDGGATDSGRPYFVMELVKGVPITEFCDQNHLTPRQRLELFVPVCQAVQHAHQKGIIHRDLKPSNVLVTVHDTTPVPKVIDFGVAKALGQELTEKTLFTAFTQMIGTPLYMSPEQAGQSGLDIDTRSDIYSLGVLLYELLTGTTPFDKERFTQAAYDEIRRIIREEEPSKPSTKLSTAEGLPTLAANRGTEPAKLTRLVRGELDWIVMKALEKDRSRRYETANGFAMDVQRYLADETVQACPPSAGYRLRKFVRRNKAALVTVVFVGVLLFLLGVGVPFHLLLRQERDRAVHNQERAETAEREIQIREHLAQAAVYRQSGETGRRLRALEQIKKAMALDPSPELRQQLRNEAIACLALTDVRPTTTKPGDWPDSNRKDCINARRSSDGKSFEVGSLRVTELAYALISPDRQFLAICNLDGRLRIWKESGPEPALVVDAHDPVEKDHCGPIAFSRDGQQLALARVDGSISVYDLGSGQRRRLAATATGPLLIAVQPQGRLLAVLYRNHCQIRELSTGKVVGNLGFTSGEAPYDRFPYIAWHPDGNMIATVGGDDVIVLWHVATGNRHARLKGHTGHGISFGFSNSGRLLASSSHDFSLRFWDTRSGALLFSTREFTGSFPRFSPDDRELAIRRADRLFVSWAGGEPVAESQVAEIYEAEAYATLEHRASHDKTPTALTSFAISPDGRLLAAVRDSVYVWDLQRRERIAHITDTGNYCVLFQGRAPAMALITSPDAAHYNADRGVFRRPITETEPGTLQIGPPERISLPGGSYSFAGSQSGRILAAGCFTRGQVLHFDRPNNPVGLAHRNDPRFVAISPDDRWVATGSYHGAPGAGAKIWDARTGRLEADLPVGSWCRVGFSSDGKWLLAGPLTRCHLYRVGSWKAGLTIEGQNPCFSPDPKMLALENGHGVIRLLDPDSGGEYAQLTDPNRHRSYWMAFTPDGTQLVSLTWDDDCLHVWDLRAIRRQLAELGLDWELPPYPPKTIPEASPALNVKVVPAL